MDDICARCSQHLIPEKSTVYRGHKLCADCLSGISQHANKLLGLGALVIVAGTAVTLSSKLAIDKWPWQVAWEGTQEVLAVSRGMRIEGHYVRGTLILLAPVVLWAMSLIPVLGVYAALTGLLKKISAHKALRTTKRFTAR